VNGITVARLCWELSRVVLGILDRDCVDKTGIAGVYDFHFDIQPQPAPPEPPPAEVAPGQTSDPAGFRAAIEASLQKAGLKLEAAKSTGDFLVIDHIERPSEN
jgi:uncharacterized protein (TIGR03435 family)